MGEEENEGYYKSVTDYLNKYEDSDRAKKLMKAVRKESKAE